MLASDRRAFLAHGTLGLIATSTAARALPAVAPRVTAVDPIGRLLARAGYGARIGDRAAVVAMGYEDYIERQLDPDSIPDPAADAFLASMKAYFLPVGRLLLQPTQTLAETLVRAAYGRALLSERQLHEAMVEFWNDHFHLYVPSNPMLPALKIVDDREVIRPHALDTFRTLLHAVSRSPAMLVYLDNVSNNVFNPGDKPNENYARELLELHTLSVRADYTQDDVRETARVLSGWGVELSGKHKGEFRFDPAAHDTGEKVVLGRVFPAGGAGEEIPALIDHLVDQPATALFIATKLTRRLVADEPPADLVNRVAAAFGADGDIKAMLREILMSDAFRTAPENRRLRRPYAYALAALRGLNAGIGRLSRRDIADWLRNMGQLPFQWPAPNGYPDVAAAWRDNLLPRWRFASALARGQIIGVSVDWPAIWEQSGTHDTAGQLDFIAAELLGAGLDPGRLAELTAFVDEATGVRDRATRKQEAVAAMLSSPDFQWA